MATSTDPESGGRLERAYALQGSAEAKQLYAEWAETFDADFLEANHFQAHLRVAEYFVEARGGGPILDFGCGTGVVAEALAAFDIGPIDGADLSPDMLAVAERKGVYRSLIEGDVLDGLSVPDGVYDGVVSSGTFTHGHVGPEGIIELLRLARPGAQFSLGINGSFFEAAGFAAAFDRLADRIIDLDLREVRFYGDAATGPHRNDLGYVALFRKR